MRREVVKIEVVYTYKWRWEWCIQMGSFLMKKNMICADWVVKGGCFTQIKWWGRRCCTQMLSDVVKMWWYTKMRGEDISDVTTMQSWRWRWYIQIRNEVLKINVVYAVKNWKYVEIYTDEGVGHGGYGYRWKTKWWIWR